MRNKILISTLICFTFLSNAQDLDKVKKIGDILCDCLEQNKDKTDMVRIDECGSVLSMGLAPISDNSLKDIYAKKSDTYLQRNCFEYAKLISNNTPESDLTISNSSFYDELKTIDDKELKLIQGKYSYKDNVGDSILVEINSLKWIEKISSTNKYLTFQIHADDDESYLMFLESNIPFFQDYYEENEIIHLRAQKIDENNLIVFFMLGNNIYVKRNLKKIDI